MAAEIVMAQNYGDIYGGYSGEVAKNIFYLIDEDSGMLSAASNPLLRPEAGILYSYEVWIRCRCDVAPDNSCTNFIAWYVSGVPAGVTLTVNSDEVATYVAPENVLSVAGTRVDFTTKNSEGNSIALTGDLINIDDYTSYLVFQLQVTPDTDTGDQAVSWIIQYDET